MRGILRGIGVGREGAEREEGNLMLWALAKLESCDVRTIVVSAICYDMSNAVPGEI
jgi:hypothetical protein